MVRECHRVPPLQPARRSPVSQVVILNSFARRQSAKRLCEIAPEGSVVKVDLPRRTNDQNSLMHALLSDVSRAKPEGRVLAPEVWKCLFMAEAGFKCTFEPSLDGKGFVPLGFKSSRLNKAEFSDLIEAIYSYAAEQGIVLGDEPAQTIEAGTAKTAGLGSRERGPKEAPDHHHSSPTPASTVGVTGEDMTPTKGFGS